MINELLAKQAETKVSEETAGKKKCPLLRFCLYPYSLTLRSALGLLEYAIFRV